MIIKGTVFPVNKINANGWGLPYDEISRAVTSLQKSPIRICKGFSKSQQNNKFDHSCDLGLSTITNAGVPLNVYYNPLTSSIDAEVEIHDTDTQNLIKDGILNGWSVYGDGLKDSTGFVHNYNNKSLTLVSEPAWSDSTFRLLESQQNEDSAITASKSNRFTYVNYFKEVTMTPDGKKTDEKPELTEEEKFLASFKEGNDKTQAKIDTVIASTEAKIADLAKQNELMFAKLEQVIASIGATTGNNDKKDTKSDAKQEIATTDNILASRLDSLEKLVPKTDDIEKLVAARLAEQTENIARNEAITKYMTLTASLGIKGITADQFKDTASTAITAQIAVLEQLEASRASAEPVYKAYSEEAEPDIGKFTLGVPELDVNGKVIGWKV